MSTLDRLYDVAEDDEIATIDRLAERAGLIWVCPIKPWTNRVGARCPCGRTQVEAADHAASHDQWGPCADTDCPLNRSP